MVVTSNHSDVRNNIAKEQCRQGDLDSMVALRNGSNLDAMIWPTIHFVH